MAEQAQSVSRDKQRRILDILLTGNQRFISGQTNRKIIDQEARKRTLSSQNPIAVILACSDSRVAPEILFDQSIGDIFVVRTAGNVLDDVSMGSIEYAVEQLHVSVILVLGHQGCGAVTAAVQGAAFHGHIEKIIENIRPAVRSVGDNKGDHIVDVINANTSNVVAQIESCEPILAEMAKSQSICVIGARYDLDTGRVVILKMPFDLIRSK